MGLNLPIGMGLNTLKMGLNTFLGSQHLQNWSQHLQCGSQHLHFLGGCWDTCYTCRDPFWEVLRPPKKKVSQHLHKQLRPKTNGSQHLWRKENDTLNNGTFRRKMVKKSTPVLDTKKSQHHVASVHGSLNSLMCDVALSSIRRHDDPQHENPMNS